MPEMVVRHWEYKIIKIKNGTCLRWEWGCSCPADSVCSKGESSVLKHPESHLILLWKKLPMDCLLWFPPTAVISIVDSFTWCQQDAWLPGEWHVSCVAFVTSWLAVWLRSTRALQQIWQRHPWALHEHTWARSALPLLTGWERTWS